MLKLSPAWRERDYFFVLFKKPVLKEFEKREPVMYIPNPERNPFRFVHTAIVSLRIYLKQRPEVVLTTGAGMAVAFCYIAKAFGSKIVFIEDWCIVEKPSLSGRLLYPIADLFVIQREHLKVFYPKAQVGGELF